MNFLPDTLIRADGSTVDSKTLEGKTIVFYFSAHWCPPCRAFTPKLVDLYNQANRDDLEVIFVSSDKTVEGQMQYMNELHMPWLAIPFGPKIMEIGRAFRVRGIPFLVSIKPDGTEDMNNLVSALQMGGIDKFNQL
eukprot:TRINITY_DN3250_c4_g2_i2.p1 TRINITY_DN3250_c4_g2~~TRINITY_DN3250_c4_g2_i2.p1  ORF type:complete len:136 (+),score=36.04 TRINITY_DN3250_c4_g2_i2:36-443(+)